MYEQWKTVSGNYQVSNFGNFRKKIKKGYRQLRPYKKRNIWTIKIDGKELNCSRLVVETFIRKLNDNERIYHINGIPNDNFVRNLKIVTTNQLGKITGYKSRSQAVVEIKNGEAIRRFRSSRQCGKELFISRQTVSDYCNGKVRRPLYNLMWEKDYYGDG